MGIPCNRSGEFSGEEEFMFGLLAKLIIKNPEDVSKPEVRLAYGMLGGFMGIGLNILLFTGKFAAGLISNSIAITADAFNNLSDAGSSFITLIGFKLSSTKPDPEHPFGHGRIEYLSGLCVAALIIMMAVELLKSSLKKIIHPEAIKSSTVVLVILVVSILVKLYMCSYNRSVGKKIASSAMMATATDSLSDSVATTVVLLSTLVARFTGLQIDGYCGLLVGVFILLAGVNAAKDTISPLLGTAPEPEFVQQILDIVADHQEILGIHDMVVHDYGPGRVMVSLHAEVPASGDICVLHDAVDLVETELKERLGCHAVIHMDPISLDDPETMKLKGQILGLIENIDSVLTMHDFRLVKGSTHTNLIFDVLLPYDFRYTDKEVQERLEREIQELDMKYHAIINIDKSFTGESGK